MNNIKTLSTLIIAFMTGCAAEAVDNPVDCSAVDGLELTDRASIGDRTFQVYLGGTVVSTGGKSSTFVQAGGRAVAVREERAFLVSDDGTVTELMADLSTKTLECKR